MGNEKVKHIVLLDVTPLSLGVSADEGCIHVRCDSQEYRHSYQNGEELHKLLRQRNFNFVSSL
jgi:hypothetical protein